MSLRIKKKASNFWSILVITIFLGIIYAVHNFIVGRFIGSILGSYILPALLWGVLASLVYFLPPRLRTKLKRDHRQLFCWAAVICAVISIITMFAAGFINGFGRSPYDHSIRGILINCFYIGLMLVGMELSRWRLIKLCTNHAGIGIFAIALIYTFFSFPYYSFLVLTDIIHVFEFFGGTFLPLWGENLLASYLAFLAGPLPALIYRGIIAAVQWFSPILPDLNWITRALVGAFIPAFCVVMLHQLYNTEVLKKKDRVRSEGLSGWIITSVISVFIIWFVVGVFNYFPTAIVSGSMTPQIAVGDVVIVKKVSMEEIEMNDIIQFRVDNFSVTHRVIAMGEDEGRLYFITKGDANDNADSQPVYNEQVMGKVVYVVPKIGWPTIWLRSSKREQPVEYF